MLSKVVLAGVFFLAAGSMRPAPAVEPDSTLALDLRVFDGPTDVSSRTRVSVYRSGERGTVQTPAGPLRWMLPPGRYDADAVLERDGTVEKTRSVLGWILQPYPDEQGVHLEVINFQSHYGALKIVPVIQGVNVATRVESIARRVGSEMMMVARAARNGADYLLLVAPAGQYMVTVQPAGGTPGAAVQQMQEVAAGRVKAWRVELK